MRVCGLSRTASVLVLTAAVLVVGSSSPRAQTSADFVPVTDAVLQNPDPADWLMWRRTLDGWGYSPLDQTGRARLARASSCWERHAPPARAAIDSRRRNITAHFWLSGTTIPTCPASWRRRHS